MDVICSEFASNCACIHMCAYQSEIICVCCVLCVCEREREWAPCQAALATFSFSLRSRRSLEQRSLILSTGACGLEACCCLLACPPLCSCRPASMKVLWLSCFILLKCKSQSQRKFLYRLLIGVHNCMQVYLQQPDLHVTQWVLVFDFLRGTAVCYNKVLISFTENIIMFFTTYCAVFFLYITDDMLLRSQTVINLIS